MKYLGVAIRSKLSSAIDASSVNYIKIDDSSVFDNFSLPFTISIKGENIPIYKVEDDKAFISPLYNNGTTIESYDINTVVFINKPLCPSIFFGLPVSEEHQSGGDPTTFDYYPPVSKHTHLIIARGIATNPNTIESPSTPSVVAVEDQRDLIEDIGGSKFTEDETISIVSSIDIIKQNINDVFSGENILQALYSLVEWSIEENEDNFIDYWNNRPFVARSNFIRGESHGGVSRFEFGREFKEMYYKAYGIDLLNTYAIFRGDIFGGNVHSGSPPSNITISYTPQENAVDGNLSQGTWVYRVSAVTSSGESSLSKPIKIKIDNNKYNSVQIEWDNIPGVIRYHVYRIGSSGVVPVEYKLTTDSGLREVTTNFFEDKGDYTGVKVRRGIQMIENKSYIPSRLKVFVPPVEGKMGVFEGGVDIDESYTDEDTSTKNELVFTIYGIKSDGSIGGPHVVNVPKGTPRNTLFDVGVISDLYIGVHDDVVTPGANLNMIGGKISWSPYDLITIQNS